MFEYKDIDIPKLGVATIRFLYQRKGPFFTVHNNAKEAGGKLTPAEVAGNFLTVSELSDNIYITMAADGEVIDDIEELSPEQKELVLQAFVEAARKEITSVLN
ncbi:hypothetical protein K9N08_01035 [Candidatus Gracilibacteria bacterium]|nr:hypothetical protein [Candidatus Gracilibacteria bacterium]MCF7856127.1 hypothetical protein [Candidatus Gracilibacteria bacterium]MCF7896546.1 hypothetical protein [Candidatus Gracilibacteria bacterium]